MILTTQRTGSTFLVDCLGSHPQIECAGELLIGAPDDPRIGYRGRFRGLVKLANFAASGAWLPGWRMERYFAGGQAPVRMFKVMYNHLANPFALRYLRQRTDIRVLHLRRANLLKVHVSRLLMSMRREVQALAPVAAVSVRVDPAQAIAAMRRAQAEYQRFDALFAGHPGLALVGEELFDGKNLRTATAARVCEFLGVPLQPMHSRLVKVNPESLRDSVSNYDELAVAVARTEFADLLG